MTVTDAIERIAARFCKEAKDLVAIIDMLPSTAVPPALAHLRDNLHDAIAAYERETRK